MVLKENLAGGILANFGIMEIQKIYDG